MSKFKVGDTVVRTSGQFGNSSEGSEYVVRTTGSIGLRFEGDSEFVYAPDSYELVAPAKPKEVPTLTPVEVLECIINDVPVQYQTDSSSNWVDLCANPDHVSFYVPYTYRKKPSTVKLNGTEVVQPKLDNAVKYSQKCYTFSEGLQTVIEARPSFVADSKLYWDTREDAWAALEAITAVLRGE